MTLYVVSRLVEEYQTVEADNEEAAIEVAKDTGEWDSDGIIHNDDDLYYGYNVFKLEK